MLSYRSYLLKCLKTVTPLGLASLLDIHNSHIYKGRKPGSRVSPKLKRKLRPLMVAEELLPPARPLRLKIRKDSPESAAASIINNLEPEVVRRIASLLAKHLDWGITEYYSTVTTLDPGINRLENGLQTCPEAHEICA